MAKVRIDTIRYGPTDYRYDTIRLSGKPIPIRAPAYRFRGLVLVDYWYYQSGISGKRAPNEGFPQTHNRTREEERAGRPERNRAALVEEAPLHPPQLQLPRCRFPAATASHSRRIQGALENLKSTQCGCRTEEGRLCGASEVTLWDRI
eukprot:GHVU01067467.1.p1 GENE.GHVU01067467.1~~GHVU01067467.1.p1  ORF type:complete len:148 (+),score=4.71 GHVU01067467.1:343-786(+)